jgi:hypothetical protein
LLIYLQKEEHMATATIQFDKLMLQPTEAEEILSVSQYGVPLRALLTNASCFGGLQSGMAAMNPNSSIKVSVGKKLPFTVNWDRLPGSVREHFSVGEEGKKALKEYLEAQVEELRSSGKVFHYGQTLLSIKVGAFEQVLVKHNKLNQPLIVQGMSGGTITNTQGENPYSPHVMKMTLDCVLEVDSQWWKLRNDGVKATTCPMDLKFFADHLTDVETLMEWDIMFGIETLKGSLAYVTTYVNANGGGEIDLSQGVVHMQEGAVPLYTNDGPFHQWVKDNTQILWVEFFMANAEFRSVLAKRDAKSIALSQEEVNDYVDLYLVRAKRNGVILREKIECLAS